MTSTKANRSSKTNSSSKTLGAAVLDTLARAGLISMGVAVTLVCLWVAACVVRAIADNGIGGLVNGFVSALSG
jgi:hypothetical protein